MKSVPHCPKWWVGLNKSGEQIVGRKLRRKNFTGRQNHRNRKSKQSIEEDNLTRRQEEILTGRRNQRNLTSREADISNFKFEIVGMM